MAATEPRSWPAPLRAVFVCYTIGLCVGTAQWVEAMHRAEWGGYQIYVSAAWLLMAATVASGVLARRRIFVGLVLLSSALNLFVTFGLAVESLGAFGTPSAAAVAAWNLLALATNAAFAGAVLTTMRARH